MSTFRFYLPGRSPADYADAQDALASIMQDLVAMAIHGKREAADLARIFLAKALRDYARQQGCKP